MTASHKEKFTQVPLSGLVKAIFGYGRLGAPNNDKGPLIGLYQMKASLAVKVYGEFRLP